MRAVNLHVFSLLTCILIQMCECSDYRLVFSHVIYRHGDRSFSRTFPNDPHKDYVWPNGLGQLTLRGMKEQYELGSYLRRRYENFLSRNLTRSEIYVRSSDRDRALESCQSNLAGLYPPSDEQECNQWPDWRPIPIHAVAQQDDHLLQTEANVNCPTYKRIYNEQNSAFIAQINAKYQDFFKFIMNQTGLDKMDLFQGSTFVQDALNVEKIHGLQVPEWVDRVWDQNTNETAFEILGEMKRLRGVLEVNTLEKARLMSGFLLGDIVNRLNDKANGKLKQKMVMYSGHEGTLTGLLHVMNISNGLIIPYAACMIIELHQSINNSTQHFVNIHYRNDSRLDPFPLRTPACSEGAIGYCPLDVFVEGVKSAMLYPVAKRFEACGLNECGMPIGNASVTADNSDN